MESVRYARMADRWGPTRGSRTSTNAYPDTYQWGEPSGVYSFGQNSYGELGHGDVNDRTAPTEILLDIDVDIVDVACGNEQTTLLGANGQVYTCGYNDSGQCATSSTEPSLQPTRVVSLNDKQVASVFSANGSEHVAILTESGALYMVGFNSHGQLGLGTTTTSEPVPTLVDSLKGKRVVDVACSYFHTAIVTSEGELYSCGRNDLGQLGTDDDGGRGTCNIPRQVASLRGHHVRAVACGQHHTVVAVASGALFSFGKNDYGQLGLGTSSPPVRVPTLVDAGLEGVAVTTVACGYYHTVAVTESGAAYSFGRNEYGQLGLGHKRHVATPTAIEALARVQIVDIACGCYHSLTLSDEGKMYPFGRNNHGQLGLESSVDCVTPQIVPSLRHVFIKKVAAGFYHSICLSGAPASTTCDTTKGPSTLSSDLRRMLNNPLRSDVTFIVEGVPLHAHSCILMARCEPLEKMLDGRTKDSSLPQIEVPDCSHEVFATLLEFLYTDEVTALANPNIDVDFLLELMALADQYLVVVLKTRCEAALYGIMSVHNVCQLIQAAHFGEAFRLKRRCLSFILDRFGEVITTPAFVALPPTLLQEVLLAAARNGVAIPNQSRLVDELHEQDELM